MKKKVISVWSPAGGTGASFTAINVARLLASRELKVALLDYDLKTPSIGIYFQAEDTIHCLDNVLPFTAGSGLSPSVLESNMQKFENIHVLLGTNLPEQSHYIAMEGLEQIIEVAKGIFDYVVIDTHSTIDNAGTYVALKKADCVLVVVDKNAVMIRLYDLAKNIIKSSFQTEKFRLVINKCHKNIYMEKDDIESYLELQGAVELPLLDLELVNALNQGRWISYIDSKQCKPYTDAVEELISQYIREDFKEMSKASRKAKFSLFKK